MNVQLVNTTLFFISLLLIIFFQGWIEYSKICRRLLISNFLPHNFLDILDIQKTLNSPYLDEPPINIPDSPRESRLNKAKDRVKDSLTRARRRGFHLFPVKPRNFYFSNGTNSKGDEAKYNSLWKLRRNLGALHTVSEVEDYAIAFKKTAEYRMLCSGQGLFTKCFRTQTSSAKEVEHLIQDRIAKIELLEIKNIRFTKGC